VPNYTYPGVDPLRAAVKNKLGLTSYDDFEIVSAALVASRASEILAGAGPARSFDAAHLKAIHRHLFQDVYEWAGHTRDEQVKLSDGTVATEPMLRKVDGKPFMDGPLIPAALERIATTLRESNFLRGLPREEFAARAADIMIEINGAHPFREGNGRTQRAFVRELAKQAGHDLDFSAVTRERMNKASIAGNEQGDSTMMRRMFGEITNPARVAALEKAIDDLGRHDFPWNDSYVATAEPGRKVEVTMAGIAGDQFMARTDTAILIGQVSDLPTPHPVRGEMFSFEPTSWERTRQPPPHERTRGGRGR
jgi:cell filamentation protein